ncbi:DUF4450 domain-containing protein [Bacteroides salyersiae]|uniref:DUF4450 domain-containing protein n=3 Tax=Bacteroides salyersiae TaxID=291644 RepID=UPI00125D1769|nr:DUF4450 domain-containing protein [Bacteroides salyersiae]KAB5349851.1 DUF4450 domain-containing protein [Bacteroides salyersiae]KAB5355816.1 DUF4450 domain-containing protein [Bacteroides salyersiae]KAB5370611.1 DUF4450 domain-containing protein [Bacteroides salyersiae]KAB5378206.1 DUF4450 domain-containing protein [Bacteroides salyersiae]KAB5387435.1 DUF4450 domain-containing protein [Bacteroides salyersiae]
MNRYLSFFLLSCFGLSAGCVCAQKPVKRIGDFIESTSYNDHKRGASRSLQYYPEGDDFVCVNGKNRYTRALYGSWSPFRLETSDRPVFATYDKRNSKNIRFRISMPGGYSAMLDSVGYCEARYTPGRRSYHLTDPAWGKGELRISALALPDVDGAIWKLEPVGFSSQSVLTAVMSEIKAHRLNRNGDMGADPADSFEAPENPQQVETCDMRLKNGVAYLVFRDFSIKMLGKKEGSRLYEKAEKVRAELASRIRIETPDAYLNTLGGALALAADGIWDGQVWLHGAVGWRMPLSGWRAAYTGDALGWHDRARTHFDAYAASQVTEVPNTIPHPAQDSVLNLARSEKRWGTPQYSNGYICRNPRNNTQMHHYDMNLCYIDELLWHFNWTGDLEYARQMWPVLVRHLAWEKLNYDPDNDGLYDAYACIWASDALYYNSGAVTHSSAYNYRANKMAAVIAEKIGEDPTPYREEAGKILRALNARLWLSDRGHWAEYQDYMGHRRLHESAGVWTIYHALDSEVADPFQAYQATRYVDTEIPHIPVRANGLEEKGYATIATTNWLPYSWSVNNVAFAEVMHTALAYFQAGRPEAGYKLMKSSVLDGMYIGDSPGNFGQISFYDAARGECYRDFGDPVGVASRLLIQGLFGILPDALNDKLVIRPGFPAEWDKASLATPDLSYRFRREGMRDIYTVKQHFANPMELSLQINAFKERIESVKVNGVSAKWAFVESASGCPVMAVTAPAAGETVVEIIWSGASLRRLSQEPLEVHPGQDFSLTALEGTVYDKFYDPQGILVDPTVDKKRLAARISGQTGHHTFFVLVEQEEMKWWQPVNVNIKQEMMPAVLPFTHVKADSCEPIDITSAFNASVTDIYRNEYLSPRSPYTTLQLPKQGIGEWCHPTLTADIDDSGMRALVRDGLLSTNLGVSFRTPEKGNNIAFTSLWDNYPDSLSIPLTGRASRAYLLMAGSTNHMQCHIVNGVVRVHYADGTAETLELVNPENWCPIEQDFYVDGMAFRLQSLRPYRLHLKSGLVSNNLEKDLNITGVYGRPIDGGAGILLDMPLNPDKDLKCITLETVSNDVVIGLMGITLQK